MMGDPPVLSCDETEDAARETIQRIDSLAIHHDVHYQGCTVRWRQWGEGAPLVLLHGGHGSWLHWIRNIESLSGRHSVWIPDLPGFGDSQDLAGDPHDPQRQSKLLDTLQGTLDDLLGSESFIDLAGFSFGGLVAGQLAAQRGSVKRLALLGPVGHGGTRRQTRKLIDWRVEDRSAMLSALQHNLQSFMLYEPQRVDSLALLAHETASRSTRYRSKALSRSTDLVRALEILKQPILMLWGEHDVTAFPAEAAQLLAQEREDREWCIVPGAGHWVQYQRHHEINQLLERWFESASGQKT